MDHPRGARPLRARVAAGLVAAVAVLGAGGFGLTRAAAADGAAPATAWWAQVGAVGLASGLLPGVLPPGGLLGPSSGELPVVNAANGSGPSAYSALHYVVPRSVAGQAVDPATSGVIVTLAVAPGSGSVLTDVVACPTASPWSPGDGQPWAARPAYRCGGRLSSPGQVSPDGSAESWSLSPAQQTGPGVYDFALVPTSQLPFEVIYGPPTAASVTVLAGAPGSGSATSSSGGGAAGTVVPGSGGSGGGASGTGSGSPGTVVAPSGGASVFTNDKAPTAASSLPPVTTVPTPATGAGPVAGGSRSPATTGPSPGAGSAGANGARAVVATSAVHGSTVGDVPFAVALALLVVAVAASLLAGRRLVLRGRRS